MNQIVRDEYSKFAPSLNIIHQGRDTRLFWLSRRPGLREFRNSDNSGDVFAVQSAGFAVQSMRAPLCWANDSGDGGSRCVLLIGSRTILFVGDCGTILSAPTLRQ